MPLHPGESFMSPPSILIIAGEVSGDMQAARLVKAVHARAPDVVFYGIGGDEMQRAGVELFQHVKDMAVMGFSEVLCRFAFFRKVYYQMVALASARRPDAVLLVDYPGFNLRFAGEAHRLGLKTIYFICPQVWAWNRARIPAMARDVNRLLAIFPFEAQHFEGTGMKVDFVGNPLVDDARLAHAAPAVQLPWDGEPRVALLPGSRIHEIQRILPSLWQAARLLEQEFPGASFILPAPSPEIADVVRGVAAGAGPGPARWKIVAGQTREVLRQARAAIVASGTATVETALMRCPMVITYRVSGFTYLMGRLLVRLPYIGMVNIVAGRAVCPEFIQHAATPEALAGAVAPLLRDGPERTRMLADLDGVVQALGAGGAADRAAAAVLEELAIPAAARR
jgi:lipid-A-disaccharide synthase